MCTNAIFNKSYVLDWHKCGNIFGICDLFLEIKSLMWTILNIFECADNLKVSKIPHCQHVKRIFKII